MAEYVGAGGEDALALLVEQAVHEVGGVVLVGALVAQQDAALQVALHLLAQVLDVLDEVVDGEGLLEYVRLVGAGGEAGRRGQVAAEAAHGLDHEDASLGADRRLLDLVAHLHDLVERCVAADAQVRAGHVVRYGRRYANERYAELGELGAHLVHLQNGGERLEAADDEQAVDLVRAQRFGDALEADLLGVDALAAEQRAAERRPAVHAAPVELLDVAGDEALEAVVDGERSTPLPHTVPHERAHGRVDAARGRAHVHHRQRVVELLVALVGLGLQLAQLQARGQIALEAGAAQLDGVHEVALGHRLGHLLGLGDRGHERHVANEVAVERDDNGLALGLGVHQLYDGLGAHARAEHAVEGGRGAAALHVAEHGHARVDAQILDDDVAHVLGRDGVAVAVDGALGHDHDVEPVADLALKGQPLAQLVLPAVLGRILRYHDPVGVAGQAGRQRQVAAVATHHLHDEATLVAQRRGRDGVHRLDDTMQRGVGADGHVRAAEVVVDRADQTHDVQERVLVLLGRRYLIYSHFLTSSFCCCCCFCC